ncbi:MAG: hypothetical protein ACP5I2_05780 [Fervidicoccaceae archaeon]|jgi:hypothetical protein
MNLWLVAALIYVALFVISITIAFIIDTLRIFLKRVMNRGKK